jgi:hypothetical protein
MADYLTASAIIPHVAPARRVGQAASLQHPRRTVYVPVAGLPRRKVRQVNQPISTIAPMSHAHSRP